MVVGHVPVVWFPSFLAIWSILVHCWWANCQNNNFSILTIFIGQYVILVIWQDWAIFVQIATFLLEWLKMDQGCILRSWSWWGGPFSQMVCWLLCQQKSSFFAFLKVLWKMDMLSLDDGCSRKEHQRQATWWWNLEVYDSHECPWFLKIKIGCYGNHVRAKCEKVEWIFDILTLTQGNWGYHTRMGESISHIWVFTVCELVEQLVHKDHFCEMCSWGSVYVACCGEKMVGVTWIVMPSSFGPDVPGDASFHFVKIRSLGVEQYVIWCGMYLYVRVEVGQPVSGFVFGEWGRIYCTKCFIWDMWMIFLILKCAKDFFSKGSIWGKFLICWMLCIGPPGGCFCCLSVVGYKIGWINWSLGKGGLGWDLTTVFFFIRILINPLDWTGM